jgi:hypothetical protein
VKNAAGTGVLEGGRPGQLQYPDLSTWLTERKNWNAIPHQFERCGYTRVNNDKAKDGYWKVGGVGGRRQAVYARKDLSPAIRVKGAEVLAADRERRQQAEQELMAMLQAAAPAGQCA